MIYPKWFVLVLASLIIDLAGVIVVALAVAITDKGKPLSRGFWPWDNDREPFGDTDHKAEMDTAEGLRYKWLRYKWLAWRNPGNNFGYLCGFTQAPDTVYTFTGDPLTSDQGHPGTLRVTAPGAFCYYSISRPYSFFGRRCVRTFVGWKIHDMSHDGTKAQLVCVWNPFMTFKEAI